MNTIQTLEEAIALSSKTPSHMFVVGSFPSARNAAEDALQQFYSTQILKSHKEDTIQFFLLHDSNVQCPTFTFLKDGEDVNQKEYTKEELEQEGVESAQTDLNLFVMSNVFAHKYDTGGDFEDDEDEEDPLIVP